MKDHKLWDENGLLRAVHVFEAIMYSIQSDLSYIVIERLMSNLNLPMNDVVQGGSSILFFALLNEEQNCGGNGPKSGPMSKFRS